MSSYLTFYDAAWPPEHPPETDGVCIYIAGDCVHVWTAAEIQEQTARYRLPVFVRSNPRGVAGVAADVNAALSQLKAIGAPRGTLVAWDMETAADKLYIAGVYSGMKAAGYILILYGSQSAVMENDNPDDLYWGADWTGVAHLHGGDVMTQWVSFASYDDDEALSSLPFWDTRPPPLKPPAKPSAPSVPSWQETIMNALPTLQNGSADHPGQVAFVRRVQALVACIGAVNGLGAVTELKQDGDFGPGTEAGVKRVQEMFGLAQDGVVGPATWQRLVAG